MKLLMNSTPIALWHDVVREAETTCKVSLEQGLEAYLVFLLDRYINKPEVAKKIMATEFLQNAKQSSIKRQLALQNVGDQCLLLSGLFPKLAEKRLVKVTYFIHIGQVSYSAISSSTNDLYDSLAKKFVTLMDILQSIRHYADELPDLLLAYELWNEAGSQRGWEMLKRYTNKALPINVNPAQEKDVCLIKVKNQLK